MLILEVFDTLPETILKVQRCHELFPGHLLLQDRALAVYLDILDMIEEMITDLADKRTCKRLVMYSQIDPAYNF
jgi:hypothetical protein